MKPMHKWYLADAGDAGLQESVEKKAGFAAVEEKNMFKSQKWTHPRLERGPYPVTSTEASGEARRIYNTPLPMGRYLLSKRQ